MDFDKLEKAKNLESTIKSATGNIEHAERLKDCNEIIIVAFNEKIRSAIKDISYGNLKGEYPPMYYNGSTKDEIVDVMTKRSRAIRDKAKQEFRDL